MCRGFTNPAHMIFSGGQRKHQDRWVDPALWAQILTFLTNSNIYPSLLRILTAGVAKPTGWRGSFIRLPQSAQNHSLICHFTPPAGEKKESLTRARSALPGTTWSSHRRLERHKCCCLSTAAASALSSHNGVYSQKKSCRTVSLLTALLHQRFGQRLLSMAEKHHTLVGSLRDFPFFKKRNRSFTDHMQSLLFFFIHSVQSFSDLPCCRRRHHGEFLFINFNCPTGARASAFLYSLYRRVSWWWVFIPYKMY